MTCLCVIHHLPKPMSEMDKSNYDKIVSFIRNVDYQIESADLEKFIEHIRPTIGIKTESSEDIEIIVGGSKIGGRPDLSSDSKWPTFNNKSMIFLAQYNLSEVKDLNQNRILPEQGLLQIFISLDHEDGDQAFQVINTNSKDIERFDFPNDLESKYRFRTAAIEYFEIFTFPHYDNYKLNDLHEKYRKAEIDFTYFRMEIDVFLEDLFEPKNIHQLLGHDIAIQSSVVYNFAARELNLKLTEPDEWFKRSKEIHELSKTFEVLIQLDCNDSNTDLSEFGGSGVFYFGITKTDLAKHNFNNIKMIYQTT